MQSLIKKTRTRKRELFLLALLANLIGIGLFISWLLQTDFIFSHFTGPRPLLLAALALLAIGLVTGGVYFATALLTRTVPPSATGPQRFEIITGLSLALVMLSAAQCFLYGTMDTLDKLGVFSRTTPLRLSEDLLADLKTGDASTRAKAVAELSNHPDGRHQTR